MKTATSTLSQPKALRLIKKFDKQLRDLLTDELRAVKEARLRLVA